MQSYYEKYLKYKTKYLNLRKLAEQDGGLDESNLKVEQYGDKDFNWFEFKDNKVHRDEVTKELDRRLREHKKITPKQISIYLQALDAKFYRNKLCDAGFKTCPTDAAEAVVLFKRLKEEFKLDETTIKKYSGNIFGYLSGRQSGGAENKTQIYLFKAEWCGHCKGFKSTWEKLQNDLKGKYEFITLDSDKDKEQISQWGIKGFPTIIKKVNDKAEEFVGPRDELSVKEFIEKS